jgi:quinol monooxygenase YgiN
MLSFAARSVLLLVTLSVSAPAADLPYFSVLSEDAGAWPDILSSIGFLRQPAGVSRIFVARTGAGASVEWPARVEHGAILILEGESSLAALFGFRRSRKDPVRVQSLSDVHRPALSIVWEQGLELPVFDMPPGAQVFATERWTGAPMSAGLKRGSGAILWVAAPPGVRGCERFPYLLNALADLGLEPPFRSNRLWAFFDSAYRTRVDVDYFAARWRKAGIAALHVAAWHNFEPDPEADAYLKKLIEACHREGILVYAWFELPHVSERFWADHAAWREQTALLQDAQLDWRKLMNLTNRECFRAVSAGVRAEVARFDWDGVNLAELYFESLEGINNPSRFTPMNADVRAQFRQLAGFDPVELYTTRADPGSRRAFLDFRAGLVIGMQKEWLAELDLSRHDKPNLDVVLTHVDDRLDTGMRDAIGADAARVLPLLDSRSFTFLIEDPATVWNLGPERYAAIAERYCALTSHTAKLAIDVNIVERYQNVYPTKQQTGTELFQLVHRAAGSFPRVALYFENSLLPPDLKLLPSAAAAVSRMEHMGPKTVVDSTGGVGIPWQGGAKVDGQLWPAQDDEFLWLPAGPHAIEPAPLPAGPRLVYLNGDLKAARAVDTHTVEFTYQSASRAIAILSRTPVKWQVDGADEPLNLAGPATLLLPRGQHFVTLTTD